MPRLKAAGFVLLMVGLNLGLAQAIAAPAEPPAMASVPSTAATALWVDVVPGPAQLQPDGVRKAIEQELALTVVASSDQPHVGRVQVLGITGPAVVVRYESVDRVTKLERRVALPVDSQRRSLVVAWVVGNLVRNEAAEILAGLASRKSAAGSTADTTTPGAASDEPSAEPSPAATGAAATAAPPAVDPPKAPATSDQSAVPTALSAPATVRPRTDEPDFGKARAINLALVSPAAALDRDAVQHRYRLSLGGAYSHIGALSGFGLTWLVDRVDVEAKGAEIAGIWVQSGNNQGILVAGVGSHSTGDLVGADVTGLVALREGCLFGAQITGVFASSGGSCQSVRLGHKPLEHRALLGIQVTGVATYSGTAFRGAQATGAAAIAADRVQGVQLAGAVAYARGGVVGVQVAGAGNVAQRQMRGTQLSGVFNVTNGNVAGVQLSGGLNVAGDLQGMQLGIVNVARDVDGLQLGVVNVAREHRGIALGLVNWARGVRIQPTYFYQTPYLHSVGMRTILGHSTSSLSFGYDEPRDIARTHFGVGLRSTPARLGVGVEFGYGWVLEHVSSGPSDRAHELDLIGTVTLEVVPNWVSIYGGGGLAQPVSGVVPIEPRGLAQAGISFF